MNSLIKERLDKIEEGIVPEGYKETKVGIIPENWGVKQFKEEFKVSQGLQIPINQRYKEKVENSHVYITNEYINNLNNSNYNREYIKSPKTNVVCNRKDILMTRTGNTGIVISKVEGVFHNNFFKIEYDEKENSQDFLIYLLKSKFMQHKILALAGVGTIPDLTHSDFYSLESLFPPLQEQEKIANILSTWDEAIENIEKLTNEKEIQKKGLMQQLLTGETRLPGFNGEWEEVKLGDVSDIYRGASPRPISDQKWFDEDSNIGWVRISDVTKSDKYLYETDQYLSKEGIKKSRFVEKDNIIMSICATVGKPIITKLDVCIHDGFVIYQNPSLNKMFLYYYLEHIESKWIRYGQIGSQMNLNINIVSNEIIKVPKQLEQKAIAEILSTADKEIELLNKLLQAKKEEKKGLMQLLLTGIVRV